jgi:hypothetical protein
MLIHSLLIRTVSVTWSYSGAVYSMQKVSVLHFHCDLCGTVFILSSLCVCCILESLLLLIHWNSNSPCYWECITHGCKCVRFQVITNYSFCTSAEDNFRIAAHWTATWHFGIPKRSERECVEVWLLMKLSGLENLFFFHHG